MARAERLAAYRRARRRRIVVWVIVAAVITAGAVVGYRMLTDDDGDSTAADSSTSAPPSTEPPAVPEGCDLERTPDAPAEPQTYDAEPPMEIDPAKTYTAALDTTCGMITITLDAANAPVATNNFVFLARQGFYDGTTWHRVVGDFVIQGGDPDGTGTGGPGYEVEGETPTDGYPPGSVAAAKTGAAPAGAFGSQFFIVTAQEITSLDQQPDYARFGTVTEGLDVARKLETFNNPSDPNGAATATLYIFSVSITEG